MVLSDQLFPKDFDTNTLTYFKWCLWRIGMLSQFHTCADKFEFPFNEDQMTYCSKWVQGGIGIL